MKHSCLTTLIIKRYKNQTKKLSVTISLYIRTHDQSILPIFGPILTSSSRAQSSINFCISSIRLLINSTPTNNTLTRHLLATLKLVKWSFKNIFNGWLKPSLLILTTVIVVIDLKNERKNSLCVNLLRPEMSLDRTASELDRIVSCLWIVISEVATDLRLTWEEETNMNILHHKRWNFFNFVFNVLTFGI